MAFILSLKNSKAECREGILNNLVKTSVDVLIYPMSFLINKIIKTQEYRFIKAIDCKWNMEEIMGMDAYIIYADD